MKTTLSLAIITLLSLLSCADASANVPDSLKKRIDSLMQVSAVSSGLEKYEADFKIAWDLFDVDNEIAVDHAGLAFGVATSAKDTAKIVRSGRIYGQLLRRIGTIDEAIRIFESILPIAEKSREGKEVERILNAVAVAYGVQFKFDRALKYNLELLKIRRLNGDSIGSSESLNGVGVVYYTLGNYSEANKYFRASIATHGATNFAYLNLAMSKLYLHDTTEFNWLMEQSVANLIPGDRESVLMIKLQAEGMYFRNIGLLDSADNCFNRALEKARAIGDRRIEAESLLGLARTNLKRGDLRRTLDFLDTMEVKLAKRRNDGLRMRCYDVRTVALERNGSLKEALEYQKRYRGLSDSLYDQRVMSNLAVALVEFEERENEMMISKQAEIIGLKEDVIFRQRWLIVTGVCAGILLVGFVFLLYRFISNQKDISIDLDRKVCERTKDLQRSENQLTQAVREQCLLMEMVSGRVHASLATFRGLMQVAVTEPSHATDVIGRFEAAAMDLLQVSRIVERTLQAGSDRGEAKEETSRHRVTDDLGVR